MNVLYLINSLSVGGAETSLAEIVGPLADEGVHVSVAVLSRAAGAADGARPPDGVEIVPGRSFPARVAALRRRLRARPPDLLHTTLFTANLAGRLAAWRTGVPVLTSLVSTPYDPIRWEDPRLSRRAFRLVRAADRWTARRLTHHFHAITEAVKEAAVRELGIPAGRITVVERGRDGERLGPRTPERRRRVRDALGLAEDDEVALHVGRHVYQKDQGSLVEAMGRLAAARPRLVLLLAGPEGPTSPDLRAAVERSPARERIRFLGYRADVPDLLAASDVFVFPSLLEGLGGALIEAMALGIPIVATDLPACREVLDEGGNAFLVERRSPAALAEAMARVLDDPALAARMGARSRAIFDARFRLDIAVAGMAALYGRVAASRRGAEAVARREQAATGEGERFPGGVKTGSS